MYVYVLLGISHSPRRISDNNDSNNDISNNNINNSNASNNQ